MTQTLWRRPVAADELNALADSTMDGHLGIRFTDVGADYLRATMPVDERTRQPFGILHGGASVALAESLGSVASNLCVDAKRYQCVGIEVNANHIRAVGAGRVTGTVRPLHVGGKIHVWEIKLRDTDERLTCVARLTVAVLERRSGQSLGHAS